jgi:hypothetical protein
MTVRNIRLPRQQQIFGYMTPSTPVEFFQFRSNVSPPSSGPKSKPSKQPWQSLLFDIEDSGSMFFWNVGDIFMDYTVSQTRTPLFESSHLLLWEPQTPQ